MGSADSNGLELEKTAIISADSGTLLKASIVVECRLFKGGMVTFTEVRSSLLHSTSTFSVFK